MRDLVTDWRSRGAVVVPEAIEIRPIQARLVPYPRHEGRMAPAARLTRAFILEYVDQIGREGAELH